jgi:hypothetical protein
VDHAHHLLESVLVFFEEIGDDDSDTPADPRHAMDEHIGFFPGFFDECEGLIKEQRNVVIFMILGRNV